MDLGHLETESWLVVLVHLLMVAGKKLVKPILVSSLDTLFLTAQISEMRREEKEVGEEGRCRPELKLVEHEGMRGGGMQVERGIGAGVPS